MKKEFHVGKYTTIIAIEDDDVICNIAYQKNTPLEYNCAHLGMMMTDRNYGKQTVLLDIHIVAHNDPNLHLLYEGMKNAYCSSSDDKDTMSSKMTKMVTTFCAFHSITILNVISGLNGKVINVIPPPNIETSMPLLQAISVLENGGTLFLRASRPDIAKYKYWWSPALIRSPQPQMDAIVDMTTINDTRSLALFVISAVSAPFSVITEKRM